ncbi:hypothetical protein DSM106972_094920 [Dulcicalothrix desertica PCC 7102]|uniref:Uncharacterized protein n=1 Tax=Dulcicalothrix desertica PCC 7102 TaxID=232991 RepID=A0A3S1I979_9CYAN|nr:hypothetical protein [Dulcicalothrix desertica]RUS93955.1 hypothetical protein DSM106972_094920 [Dulcicalothrix desertica PCC 7102]
MSKKLSSQEDIIMRADILAALMSNLEREIKQIAESGPLAPADSWILRYQVKGKSDIYWYYKLQCKEAVFPEQGDPKKFSKYKHLGKPGSAAYNEAVICLARRAKIDALERMINTIKQGWLDLYEEKEKNENRKYSRNKTAN